MKKQSIEEKGTGSFFAYVDLELSHNGRTQKKCLYPFPIYQLPKMSQSPFFAYVDLELSHDGRTQKKCLYPLPKISGRRESEVIGE